MQRFIRLFSSIAFLTLFAFVSNGQDDCLADPPPVQCVCETMPICGFEALDNYCLEMEEFQTPFSGFPGCPQNVLNNPNWFSFVAGDEEIVIRITPSECTLVPPNNNEGIQFAIYESPDGINQGNDCSQCPPVNESLTQVFTQCGCTTAALLVNLDTEPGQTYYVVLDGCGGSACHIEIDVIVGGAPPQVGEPEGELDWPIDYFQSDTLCQGAEGVSISIPDAMNASSYFWTFPDGTVEQTNDPVLENLDFPDAGLFTYCVAAANDCDTSETELCADILVLPIPTETATVRVCEGDPAINPITNETILNAAQSSDDGLVDIGSYTTDLLFCEVNYEVTVRVRNENDENPTQVTEAICIEDAGYEPWPANSSSGQPYTQTTLNDQVTLFGDYPTCDSFIDYTLYLLNAIAEIQDPLSCVDGKIELCPLILDISPDPLSNPDVNLTFEWWRESDNSLLGTTNDQDECFEIDIITDFVNDFETFQLFIQMDLAGEPMGGCLFGPFEISLDRNDFIPLIEEIQGPDTVCVGDTPLFFFLPDDYLYEIQQTPDYECLSGCTEGEQVIEFTAPGAIQLCVTADNFCVVSDPFCKEVIVLPNVAADAGPDITTCENTAQLGGSGEPGEWTVVSSPAGGTATFSSIENPQATVEVDVRGDYVFRWNTGQGQCAQEDDVNVTFSTIPVISLDSVPCDDIGENYNLIVTIVGGTPPYTVNGLAGTVMGNSFVSDLIPVSTEVAITVSDVNGCESAEFNYQRIPCDCESDAGIMDQTELRACAGECVQGNHQSGSEINDGNDVTEYILHQVPMGRLTDADIIASNATGEFCFIPGTTNPGETYFITFVIGNDSGDGTVDLEQGCTSFSQRQPVVWDAFPTADAGMGGGTCAANFMLEANATYDGEWSVVSAPAGGNAIFDMRFSDSTNVTIDLCGTYVFQWKESNRGCADSATVTVEFFCNPTVAALTTDCNDTQTAYSATIIITGGTPPYNEVNGAGTITDSTFFIDNLEPLVDQNYTFEDANGCILDVMVIGRDCNCDTDAGALDVTPLETCADPGAELTLINAVDDTLDADDKSIYAIYDAPSPTPSNYLSVFQTPTISFDDAVLDCNVQYYAFRITGTADGNLVDFTDGCLSLTEPVPVIWYCFPNADAGADTDQCGLTTTLQATAPAFGTGTWTTDQPGMVTFSDVNDPAAEVTVTDFGTYNFQWLVDNNSCQSQPDELVVNFLGSPSIDLNSVAYECDANFENYTVTFNIEGGDQSSYTVDGLTGTITGNQFVSEPIPSNSSFSVEVYDVNDCERFTFSDQFDCGCFTDVGPLLNDPVDLCEDESLQIEDNIWDFNNASIDGNDVVRFVIHDQAGDSLGNVILSQPDFTVSFNAAAGMMLETTYYLSAVAGDGLNGDIDFNDDCLSVAPGIPITWHTNPTFDVSSDIAEITCTEREATLSLTNLNVSDLSNYDFNWTASNGGSIVAGDETSQTPRVTSAGTYTVTMTHTQFGCSGTGSIDITQDANVPTVNIAPPQSLTCARTEVTVDASASSSGATITYSWTGPGIVGASDGNTVTVDQPGSYVLTIFNSANECEIEGTVNVVEDLEEPTAVANALGIIDCDTEEVTISGEGSSTGDVSYTWSVLNAAGTIVSGANNITATVDGPGDYLLTVRNNENGCEATAEVTVEVVDDAVNGATLEVQGAGCAGETNGQIVVTDVRGGIPPYQYSFNGGPYTDNNIVSGLGAGTYEVSVRDGGGCTYDTTAMIVEAPPVFVDLGDNVVVDLGDSYTVTAEASIPLEDIATIIWDPLVDSSAQRSLSQTFTPPGGTSEYRVTIIDENGCSATDVLLIVARVQRDVFIPNVISLRENSLEPNRFAGIYADPDKAPRVLSFRIYNRWGEQVFDRSEFAPSLELDRSVAWDGTQDNEPVDAGVYVYYAEVEFADGVIELYTGDITVLR